MYRGRVFPDEPHQFPLGKRFVGGIVSGQDPLPVLFQYFCGCRFYLRVGGQVRRNLLRLNPQPSCVQQARSPVR